jgi:hypothetical protein
MALYCRKMCQAKKNLKVCFRTFFHFPFSVLCRNLAQSISIVDQWRWRRQKNSRCEKRGRGVNFTNILRTIFLLPKVLFGPLLYFTVCVDIFWRMVAMQKITLRNPICIFPTFHFTWGNLSNLLHPPIALKATEYRERPWRPSLQLAVMKFPQTEKLPTTCRYEIPLTCSYENPPINYRECVFHTHSLGFFSIEGEQNWPSKKRFSDLTLLTRIITVRRMLVKFDRTGNCEKKWW